MIKINLNKEQKEKIETFYWRWFSQYHLSRFKKIINRDINLEKFIYKGYTDYDNKIREFLLSNPIKLENIKQEIDLNNYAFNKDTEDYLKERYDNFRRSQAAKIVDVLGVMVCPYCNQNYLNVIRDKKGNFKLFGDMDHFYSKSKYPILQICLYNLIPACQVCNHLKSNEDRNIINPFYDDYKSTIKFKTRFDEKKDIAYLQGLSENFEITVDDVLTESDEIEIGLFKLDSRYEDLKRNAREIIIRTRAYDEIYGKLLQNKYGINDMSVMEMIMGYAGDDNQRALSKFNKDIFDEFRI